MAIKDVEQRPIDPEQLRELEPSELVDELGRLQEAYFRLRFRSATEALDNPLQFRTVRRNIARIKTVLRERKNI